MSVLALFDFDGTLTERDSLLDFLLFTRSLPSVLWGGVCLAPVLSAYALHMLDNGAAKEKVLAHFFQGWTAERLDAAGACYARERLPSILRKKGLERLQWHLDQGHVTCLVSASPSLWLKTWTDSMHMQLFATELCMEEGCFSGRFAGKNCHGQEKVRLIRDHFNLSSFDMIYAYGDSAGDRCMLELADEAFYKPFR